MITSVLPKHRINIPLIQSVSRWHINFFLKKKAFPLIAGLFITNRCNFTCNMCTFWRNSRDETISFEKLEIIMGDLRKAGCYYGSYTGGEPLVLTDILDRVELLSRTVPYSHIVSNGWLIDSAMAENLQRTGMNEISISIDGLCDYHDAIRNKQGAYDRALSALDNLKNHAPKVKVVVNTVICRSNIADLYELTEVLRQRKVWLKFQPMNTHPTFDSMRTGKQFDLPPSATEKDVLDFINFSLDQKHVINSRPFLRQIPNYLFDKHLSNRTEKYCPNPYFFYEIRGVNGATVSPCLLGTNWQDGFPIGNSFKAVIQSAEYQEAQKDLLHCNKCDKNMQICYWEPRYVFPLGNALKTILTGR